MAKRSKCNYCKYSKYLGGNNASGVFCDYLCMTGQRRNSDPLHCDKYKKGKTRLTYQPKEKILT